MSTFTLKLNAAKNTSAWHLALDKYPFDIQRPNAVWLTRPDDRNKEQSIKPHRLREIKERAAAATAEWKTALARQQRFLAALSIQHGSRFRRVSLVNSSRLLLHLGRASVLENVGLYCERTTGLPLIPGSAVKGVVSTWACWEGNASRDTFTLQRSQFGSEIADILGANPANDSGVKDSAGGICFLGGFPQTVPGLELDIVTPHPQEGRGRITPSSFLAIRPETKWDFALLAAPRIDPQKADAFLNRAICWITDCLTQVGVGAKTAAGYGNFRSLTESEVASDQERFKKLTDKIKEEIAIGTMTPEDQAYLAFKKGVTDWAPQARDIGSKPEPDKSHVLRFFRSEEGQTLIKGWPKNDKAKKRLEALKNAGL